jgi:hypothetical protein
MENIMNKTWARIFGFIILMVAEFVWAAPVPDSGQTKCYNNTVEIPCPSPGQPFYGQDANYSINPMSYTKLDSSGNILPDSAEYWVLVKDNVTGLIWESKTSDGTIHDKDNLYSWYDPTNPYPGTPGIGTDTKDFIDALNVAVYGGYGDWRMPTVKELGTLINYDIQAPEPAIDTTYFPVMQTSYYWSSTTFAMDKTFAWYVYFYDGYDGSFDKNFSTYARAVRGGQSESPGILSIGSFEAVGNRSLDAALTAAGDYVDNGDGTVTDKSTGLMWQKASSSIMTWEQALAYCEELNHGGYTDWRLPTKRQLRSLVDFSRYDPSIDTAYFPDTGSSYYWSSTTDVFNTNSAWSANFYNGNDGRVNKLRFSSVRAVRGGEAPPIEGCTATIDENALLHIPYLSYDNPLLGTISLWADFAYEYNPMYLTAIFFKLINAGVMDNPSYLCATSTLSNDLKIHIPDVLFSDGSTHLWVDLEYIPELSTDESTYFIVTNFGLVSN